MESFEATKRIVVLCQVLKYPADSLVASFTSFSPSGRKNGTERKIPQVSGSPSVVASQGVPPGFTTLLRGPLCNLLVLSERNKTPPPVVLF